MYVFTKRNAIWIVLNLYLDKNFWLQSWWCYEMFFLNYTFSCQRVSIYNQKSCFLHCKAVFSWLGYYLLFVAICHVVAMVNWFVSHWLLLNVTHVWGITCVCFLVKPTLHAALPWYVCAWQACSRHVDGQYHSVCQVANCVSCDNTVTFGKCIRVWTCTQ